MNGWTLRDVLPARWRKMIYALVTMAAIGFSAWQAADGNWETFVGGVIAALTTALATANTNPPPTVETPPPGK